MKSRWRDGLNKFRRDNNVRWRGCDGRYTDREGTGFDSWYICGKSEKKFWGRYVHKAERRAITAKLNNPQTIVDAYWELDLAWDDSWFEEETDAELAELGLNKFGGTTYIDLLLEDFSMYDMMDDLEEPFNNLEHFDPRLDDIAEGERAFSAFEDDYRPLGHYHEQGLARDDENDLAETNLPSLDVSNL